MGFSMLMKACRERSNAMDGAWREADWEGMWNEQRETWLKSSNTGRKWERIKILGYQQQGHNQIPKYQTQRNRKLRARLQNMCFVQLILLTPGRNPLWDCSATDIQIKSGLCVLWFSRILSIFVPATQTELSPGSCRAYRKWFPWVSPWQHRWEWQLQETAGPSGVGQTWLNPYRTEIWNLYATMELLWSFDAPSHGWGTPVSLSKLCSAIHSLQCSFGLELF